MNAGVNSLIVHSLLLLIGFGQTLGSDVTFLGPDATLYRNGDSRTKKCQYQKIYSKLEADCTQRNLQQIPSNLKKDIQILIASGNRIRSLANDSLAPYEDLAYLYLNDNFIIKIEEGAFAHQSYLEVLDLTTNGLINSLPQQIFHLPLLRTLYLADNDLHQETFPSVEDIKSPIQILQLAKNKFTKVPRLGSLPSLNHLNLSMNHIDTISIDDLAPYCSLKTLDISGNPIKFNESGCDCETLTAWVKLREINMQSTFTCNDKNKNCEIQFSNKTLELYDHCENIIRETVAAEKARSMWIKIAGFSGFILFTIFVSLYCIHKKNKKHGKKIKEQQQRESINNANTELLYNNGHQTEQN